MPSLSGFKITKLIPVANWERQVTVRVPSAAAANMADQPQTARVSEFRSEKMLSKTKSRERQGEDWEQRNGGYSNAK